MKKIAVVILLLMGVGSVFAQSNILVKGKVIDKDTKETLVGVSVVLQSDPTKGVNTDLDGNFDIILKDDNDSLLVSYLGYESVTVSSKNPGTIELASSAMSLDDVVVIGYGTTKKSDITGSVGSIKNKDLNVLSTVNIQEGMAGRAAGVSVINTGSVDGNTKVRIRGIGTINNSDPLYVVDGFSTTDISYLAPTDIQSMEILKDASATAIYGSRGANGVILITTTKGKVQPTQVSINTFYGFSNPSKTLDLLDAADYGRAKLEANTNGGTTLSPEFLSMINYAIDNNKKGTNWQKEVLRTAESKNYNIGINGGTEKAKYNFTSTYNKTEGVLKNSYVNKLMIRLNTQYQLSDKVTFGTDISYVDNTMSMSDYSNPAGSNIAIAGKASPITPVYDQFGNWNRLMSNDGNPVRLNEQSTYDKRYGTKFVGNFFLNYDILKGLSFKSTFGGAYGTSSRRDYSPTFYVDPQEFNETSSLLENRATNGNWIWSNVATYNFTLKKDHEFTAVLGTEAVYDTFEGITATAFDVSPNEDLRYLSAAKSDKFVATSDQGTSTIFSKFFRFNYAYKGKYLVTGTVRSDESSKFSKDKRQGVFPSVSLGWNMKEESFMQNVDAVAQFKLRAGWGQVGNQSSTGIGDYLSTISNGKKYVLGGNVYEGRIPETLSNPDLKWEIAQQTNIGLDVAFFGNKLTMTGDYFIKDTKDMIVRAPIPAYVGALAPLANVGNMRNSGFEYTIGYRDHVGDFKYGADLNLSFITNEITSLGDSGSIFSQVDARMGATSVTSVGQPIANYWGLKTDGIFHNTEELAAHKSSNGQLIQPSAQLGDVKYIDLNGDGIINSADQTNLGNYLPKVSGGLNLNGEYENFTLSVFFDFSYGGEIANTNKYYVESGLMEKNITQEYYNNRWTPEMPNNNQPRLTTDSQNSENIRFSDRYVEDGSFLRIRNLQLGYNLPDKFLKGIRTDFLRLYVSADNLYTFTNYSGLNPVVSDQFGNPLVAGSDMGGEVLPTTVSLGLNIKF